MQRTLAAGSLIPFASVAAAAVFLFAAPAANGRNASPEATPHGDPAVFLTRIVGHIVGDDYARAWPSLHPTHKTVAPRDEYIACELRTPVGSTLESAEVVRVTRRIRRIPGAPERVPVASVTLRLEIVDASLKTTGVFVHTFNAVPVGSRWTWILTPSRYQLYRSDACVA